MSVRKSARRGRPSARLWESVQSGDLTCNFLELRGGIGERERSPAQADGSGDPPEPFPLPEGFTRIEYVLSRAQCHPIRKSIQSLASRHVLTGDEYLASCASVSSFLDRITSTAKAKLRETEPLAMRERLCKYIAFACSMDVEALSKQLLSVKGSTPDDLLRPQAVASSPQPIHSGSNPAALEGADDNRPSLQRTRGPHIAARQQARRGRRSNTRTRPSHRHDLSASLLPPPATIPSRERFYQGLLLSCVSPRTRTRSSRKPLSPMIAVEVFGQSLFLYDVYSAVHHVGGLDYVERSNSWSTVAKHLGIDLGLYPSSGLYLSHKCAPYLHQYQDYTAHAVDQLDPNSKKRKDTTVVPVPEVNHEQPMEEVVFNEVRTVLSKQVKHMKPRLGQFAITVDSVNQHLFFYRIIGTRIDPDTQADVVHLEHWCPIDVIGDIPAVAAKSLVNKGNLIYFLRPCRGEDQVCGPHVLTTSKQGPRPYCSWTEGVEALIYPLPSVLGKESVRSVLARKRKSPGKGSLLYQRRITNATDEWAGVSLQAQDLQTWFDRDAATREGRVIEAFELPCQVATNTRDGAKHVPQREEVKTASGETLPDVRQVKERPVVASGLPAPSIPSNPSHVTPRPLPVSSEAPSVQSRVDTKLKKGTKRKKGKGPPSRAPSKSSKSVRSRKRKKSVQDPGDLPSSKRATACPPPEQQSGWTEWRPPPDIYLNMMAPSQPRAAPIGHEQSSEDKAGPHHGHALPQGPLPTEQPPLFHAPQVFTQHGDARSMSYPIQGHNVVGYPSAQLQMMDPRLQAIQQFPPPATWATTAPPDLGLQAGVPPTGQQNMPGFSPQFAQYSHQVYWSQQHALFPQSPSASIPVTQFPMNQLVVQNNYFAGAFIPGSSQMWSQQNTGPWPSNNQ